MPSVSLTKELSQVIKRIKARGRYANTSEVVRAGLCLLEKQELDDYLHPVPLPPGALEQIYAEETPEQRKMTKAAAQASVATSKKALKRGYEKL